MLNKENLLQLMKKVGEADPTAPVAYEYNGQSLSYEALNETLRRQFEELAGTPQALRRNEILLFELMEDYLTDIVPKKVAKRYQDIAEVRTFEQGVKPLFKRKLNNRARGKQFVTRVGLAGRYEVFKLGAGDESFEVPTSALGGAAQVGYEEFLDKRVDFNELINVILDGMDEAIYLEGTKALEAAAGQLPAANKVSCAGFDEESFDTLISIVAAYGTPVIYCTPEFAAKCVPAEEWRFTDRMKEELWKNNRLANYKSTKVVILEQTFTDETNAKKELNPGICYIVPAGTNKPLKISFEGTTNVRKTENEDWSKEFQAYRKVGVGVQMTNDMCIYTDTSLAGQFDTWNH